MATQVRTTLFRHLDELRYETTDKRVRALLGREVVADTTDARLVWEPRRIVPTYAVPVAGLRAELGSPDAAAEAAADAGFRMPSVSERPVLDPGIPFGVHTTAGTTVEVRTPGGGVGAGFRPTDPDLADHVVLDFDAFDWLEEDEAIVSHPRDPFHRVDVLESSRHVRIERDGELLAETTRPRLLFETSLPARSYLPREDVSVPLEPSPTRTWCAYKGQASYWSPVLRGGPAADLGWSYESPRHDAAAVAGMVAFFDERVDVTVDGVRRPRPITPWS